MAVSAKEITVIGKKELVGKSRKLHHVFDAIVYNRADFHKPPLERIPFDLELGQRLTEEAIEPAMVRARAMALIPGAEPVVAVRHLSTEKYPHLSQKP